MCCLKQKAYPKSFTFCYCTYYLILLLSIALMSYLSLFVIHKYQDNMEQPFTNTFIALALILGFISISTILVGSITFLCKDNKFCGKFWNMINCLSVTMTIAILSCTGYALIYASVNGNDFV